MYCKIENNAAIELVETLPSSGKTADGRSCGNLAALPLAILKEFGYLPVTVNAPSSFDETMQLLDNNLSSASVTANSVIINQTVVYKPIEELKLNCKTQIDVEAFNRAKAVYPDLTSMENSAVLTDLVNAIGLDNVPQNLKKAAQVYNAAIAGHAQVGALATPAAVAGFNVNGDVNWPVFS